MEISKRFRNFVRVCALACAGIAGVAGLSGLTTAGAQSPRCDAIQALINRTTDPAVLAALQVQYNAACTTPTSSNTTTSSSTSTSSSSTTSTSSTSTSSTSTSSTTSTTLSPALCQLIANRIAAATDPALIAALQAFAAQSGCTFTT